MGRTIMDIVMLFVLASLAVLIIMNPSGFAQDVTSLGGYAIAQTTVFTGSGYKKAA
jgi:hypothetical protein